MKSTKSLKVYLLNSVLLCMLAFSTSAVALRIADLNMQNYDDGRGRDTWPERLEKMAQDIDNTKADIITLQEVLYNNNNPASADGANMA